MPTTQHIVRSQWVVRAHPTIPPVWPAPSGPVSPPPPQRAAGPTPAAPTGPAPEPPAHAPAAPMGTTDLATTWIVTSEQIAQTIGAAQADTTAQARATAAALRPVQLLGLGLLTAGIACLAVPALRMLIGSITTCIGLVLGGLVLSLAPALVPGRETMLTWAILIGIAIYWWAHRHGEIRALVKTQQKP